MRYFYVICYKGYMIFPLVRSIRETMTVQAPHPPSAHPSFVPHSRTVLFQSRQINRKVKIIKLQLRSNEYIFEKDTFVTKVIKQSPLRIDSRVRYLNKYTFNYY